MTPAETRTLLSVLVIGALIAAVAVTALYIAFRSFGRKSSIGILAALIGFIFVCCVALLLISHE